MFIKKDKSIYVDCHAMEVYLPYDYLEKAYRGNSYYSLIGSKVRFFAVGNMRFFKSEKEMEDVVSIPTYTLGFPMFIVSEPSDIDTREVQFVKGGVIRKCIVLTYYKNDVFVDNVNCISNSDAVMIVMARLEGGKLDHIPPEHAIGIFQDVQTMNRVALRIPTEEEEIFIAERYRNPNNHSQKARFNDKADPDRLVSYNMRQDAMKDTTYQALTHEDINTSLITSINRKNDGIIDEPTVMEKVVMGKDLSADIEERDRTIDQNRERIVIDEEEGEE